MNVTADSNLGALGLSAAKFVWGVGLTIYVYFSNRRKALKKVQKETDDKIAALDARTACIEQDIKHMPSQKDIQDLSSRMDLLNGTLANLEGRLGGINRAVDLMNEFLINRGNR